MNGKAVVAGIMPLAAAAIVGGILIATNHTAVAVPHLNHGKAKTVQGILTHKPQMADFAACRGRIREPFIGVAPETRNQGKNIALSIGVNSFMSATKARIRIVEI